MWSWKRLCLTIIEVLCASVVSLLLARWKVPCGCCILARRTLNFELVTIDSWTEWAKGLRITFSATCSMIVSADPTALMLLCEKKLFTCTMEPPVHSTSGADCIANDGWASMPNVTNEKDIPRFTRQSTSSLTVFSPTYHFEMAVVLFPPEPNVKGFLSYWPLPVKIVTDTPSTQRFFGGDVSYGCSIRINYIFTTLVCFSRLLIPVAFHLLWTFHATRVAALTRNDSLIE